MRSTLTLFWGKAKVPSKIEHAMGLDPIRLSLSAYLAFLDFTEGCTLSRKFPLEVLMYYYTTRQISEAIARSNEELRGSKEAYFADIELPSETLWVTSLQPSLCLFRLADKDWLARVLELVYYKRKRCKKDVQERRNY